MPNPLISVVDDIFVLVPKIVLFIDFRYGPVGLVTTDPVSQLIVSASIDGDQHESPKRGTMIPVASSDAGVEEPLPPEGLFLGISRSVTAGSTVLMVSAGAPPPSGKFTLVVHARLPTDLRLVPTGPGVKWAVTLIGRNGTPSRTDATQVHVGATHQIVAPAQDVVEARTAFGVPTVFGPRVQLGVAQAMATSGPAPVHLIEAYPDHRRDFTLETDIDLEINGGRSRLRTPGHVFPERRWKFPDGFGELTEVGFGLAIATGTGRASASIQDFSLLAALADPVNES